MGSILPCLASSVKLMVNLSNDGVLLGAPGAGALPLEVSPIALDSDSAVVPTIARVTSRNDSG